RAAVSEGSVAKPFGYNGFRYNSGTAPVFPVHFFPDCGASAARSIWCAHSARLRAGRTGAGSQLPSAAGFGRMNRLDGMTRTKVATEAPPRVLLADDQQDVLTALKLLLADEDYSLVTATSPNAVLRALEESEFDAVVMDLNYTRDTTSGKEGLTLLQCIRGMDDTLPVIVMTAWASVESAVAAMRYGASDYVEKPWNDERLLQTLRTQIELRRALRKARRLEAQNERLQRAGLPELIAGSPVMEPVLETIQRVAASDANVLITGEHGTGK